MPLSTLTRPNRLRNLRAAKTSHRLHPARPAAPEGVVIPLASPPATPPQLILSVEFSSPDGRTWQAIGGGDTLAAAIAFAEDSCPTDTTWRPARWNDLYGD